MTTREELLRGYDPEVQAIALAVRELVLAVVPEAVEKVYPGWRIFGYSLNGKLSDQFGWIAPQTGWVYLGFAYGAYLVDAHGLLLNVSKSKLARSVKITQLAEIDRSKLEPLLEANIVALLKAKTGQL